MGVNLPRWFWWLLGLVLIIIICVVLKINLSGNIGSSGIGISLNQGLVH